MPNKISLTDIHAPVAHELNLVRTVLNKTWVDVLELSGAAGALKPTIGGKLLRPTLCFLSAGSLGAQDLSPYVSFAAACELLHVAALAHDDVVDHSSLRRGEKSLNALLHDRAAVLIGDCLISEAMTLLLRYSSCPIIELVINTIRHMVESELENIRQMSSAQITESDCIKLAHRKTASLFACVAEGAALLAGSSLKPLFHTFGVSIGIAFQLTDDLLDLTGTEELLGKPPCGDIVEGKTTLPILYLKEALPSHEASRINGMAGAILEANDRQWIAEQLEQTGARERTEKVIQSHLNEALAVVNQLPSTPFRETMSQLAHFTVMRQS